MTKKELQDKLVDFNEIMSLNSMYGNDLGYSNAVQYIGKYVKLVLGDHISLEWQLDTKLYFPTSIRKEKHVGFSLECITPSGQNVLVSAREFQRFSIIELTHEEWIIEGII